MRKHNRIVILFILVLLILSGCNIPRAGDPQDASNTAAAQTVQALLTITPPTLSLSSPTSTYTPIPGLPTQTVAVNTVPPAATATTYCNAMQFVADVTIPDDTVVTPNQAFTKTWRLRNTGTCTWSTAYAVVFSSGNSMNGPSSQALPGNVAPGQTVDVSVNLVAPASPETYTGNWKLRDASGILFGQFYVRIRVQAPATNTVKSPVTINLTYLPSESGLVLSGGSINTLTVAAGDSSSNQGVQAFLSFNSAAIPAGSTIQSASIRLKGGGSVRGDPFGGLGCLRAYIQNFGTVDAGDYVGGSPLGAIARWCSAAETEANYGDATFASAVQASVGTSRFQIRLQFNDTLTDNDATIDDFLVLEPVTLTVTYLPP